MIAAWAASFGGDVMVSGLVKATQIEERCEFGTGVICDPLPNTMLNTPDWENTAVTVVNASSLANGGLGGIYRKANLDPNFSG